MRWFEVDKEGLGKVLARRGKAFVFDELLQNVWDTAATRADVLIRPVPGSPRVEFEVSDDDPTGFEDLAHAYTLFAESKKKGDPKKRGRWNLGEKLALAVCDEAGIESTTGTVTFDARGRHRLRRRRAVGSRFYGTMRMSRAELDEVLQSLRRLIPPEGVETTINGERLQSRTPVRVFDAVLPTEIADAEGNLRRTERKTEVHLYEPLPGEVASLYEMGIPVVETRDRFHIDVGQKVPLNFDRDNVPPGYLRRVRTLVANEAHALLREEDASATWVREALADERSSDEAVRAIVDRLFGPKHVIYDPSDPEANKIAVSKDYTVISGSMLSKDEWQSVRRAGAALPAGQVTPSPRPYDPDGEPLVIIPPEKWTDDMLRTASYATRIARAIIDQNIAVTIANDLALAHGATYGKVGSAGSLVLNLARLGHRWFAETGSDEMHELLLHEFAHERVSDHLSDAYHRECCRLGAKLTRLALDRPDLFTGARASEEVRT